MPNPTDTVSIEDRDAIHEGGKRAEVADWVINLDLKPESHQLYLRMCLYAREVDEIYAVQFYYGPEEAEAWGQSGSDAAFKELLEVGAITSQGESPCGTPVYEIEVYSPEIRELRNGYRQVNGVPVVAYAC